MSDVVEILEKLVFEVQKYLSSQDITPELQIAICLEMCIDMLSVHTSFMEDREAKEFVKRTMVKIYRDSRLIKDVKQ